MKKILIIAILFVCGFAYGFETKQEAYDYLVNKGYTIVLIENNKVSIPASNYTETVVHYGVKESDNSSVENVNINVLIGVSNPETPQDKYIFNKTVEDISTNETSLNKIDLIKNYIDENLGVVIETTPAGIPVSYSKYLDDDNDSVYNKKAFFVESNNEGIISEWEIE